MRTLVDILHHIGAGTGLPVFDMGEYSGIEETNERGNSTQREKYGQPSYFDAKQQEYEMPRLFNVQNRRDGRVTRETR